MELRINGAPVPATLGAGIAYQVSVFVNGFEAIPSVWSVTAGALVVAEGRDSRIRFTALSPVSHTISATALGEYGLYQTVAQTVNVASNNSPAEAGVQWAKTVFTVGEALVARITARDSRSESPSKITWSLSRNGVVLLSGEGPNVSFSSALDGTYRLYGTAYCNDGTQLSFDSTALVFGSVNTRHSLPIPDIAGSAVLIGSVFSQTVVGAAGRATSLPYKVGSATEDIYLLPGTTHWLFDLDPEANSVDDEVVVRTKKGNWCLNGLAGGLAGENVGYDYQYMPTLIPAPIDHRLRITFDFFKVHGLDYRSFNARVRIKCYRLAPSVYRYERCANSTHVGGQGHRARHWAALFTNMDIQTDVFSGLNRLGTGVAAVPYSTVATTSVPLMALTASGSPNPVPSYSGLHYTDSNLYAYYEAGDYPNIAAKAVSAVESVRPCCISLLTFNSSKPILSNRIKHVYGNMVIFLTEGAVFAGSVITIKVWKSDGVFYNQYTLPVLSTQYINEDNTLLNIGEIPIDIVDFQFDETGIVVDFSVDESLIASAALSTPEPTPAAGPAFIYSPVFAHSVSYDGACYTNPVHQLLVDEDMVIVGGILGCHESLCGPAATYCYTVLSGLAPNAVLPQPFGEPAPYVAYGSNPARCFYLPVPIALVEGTNVGIAEYTGSTAVTLWGYSDDSLCGYSYLYTDCLSKYAPCVAQTCSLVVVYPVSSSPHSLISYAGRCYSFDGSTQSYGTRSVIPAADASPVLDCRDPVCVQYNASGSVVVYTDPQTYAEVPVRFDHLDRGIAYYGAAVQKTDEGRSGLTDGIGRFTFNTSPDVLIYRSQGTGRLLFEFGLSGVRKQLIVDHNGAKTTYSPGIGGSRQIVAVQPGDTVWFRITDAYGRLPLQYRNLRLTVKWSPVEDLPRLYDTVAVPYAGATSIKALGFCAYTDEASYSYYGTLPYSGAMNGPVNPDALVTVTDQGGQEYNLISERAIGDVLLYPLTGLPWYAGQVLNGPFTFKFYAAREAYGAHGEMDVWFDTDGTFPGYLRAGQYDAVALSGTYYRKDSTPTDTVRNSYKVVTASEAARALWPNVYVSSDGEVVSVEYSGSSVSFNNKTYFAPTSQPYPDTGFSTTVFS